MKCIILDDYQNVSLKSANWGELIGCSVSNITTHLNEELLLETLLCADVIVIMRERTPITSSMINQLPKLKLIVTSGMRNSSIDLKAANKKGIVVCGTKSFKRPPMELAWSLILSLSRHIPKEYFSFRNGGAWQSTLGSSLHGKTIGLIGLGHIGKLMTLVAKAFDMKVMAWSPNLTKERCYELDVIFSPTKEVLFEESDIVSIHLVLSSLTKNIITKNDFDLMKPSAFLINTSRAEIVNQNDLINVLIENKIGGAGLDVFDQEPLPFDHPFRSLNNVVATPHLGYVTDTNYCVYFVQALENIQAFMSGSPIRLIH